MQNVTQIVYGTTEPGGYSLGDYITFISAIKKYHSEAYNEFLKDLYKTIDGAKDKLKSISGNSQVKPKQSAALKEPEGRRRIDTTNASDGDTIKPTYKEVKRFQKIAGIVKEDDVQTDPVADKDAEQGLKQVLAIMQSGISNLQPSPKDGQLNESLFALAAAAPGLLQLIGKGVNNISSLFQKDKKSGTVVGNALAHWGESLEDAYLKVISEGLKKLFPSTYGNQNIKDERSALYDTSRQLYMVVLMATAIESGLETSEAGEWLSKIFYGAHTVTDIADVTKLARQVAAA